MAAALENVTKTHQVAVDVSLGVFNTVAHSCLGGKIDHGIKLLGGKQLRQSLAVGDVHFDETELSRQFGQTGMFEANVVIVVEIVEPDDLVSPFDQAFRYIIADKPCGSCD